MLEAARASPAPPGAEERVLPQLETQRTRQLPGEKRVLEKGRARARTRTHARQREGRIYRAALAHWLVLRGSRGLCAGWLLHIMLLLLVLFPSLSLFSIDRVSN